MCLHFVFRWEYLIFSFFVFITLTFNSCSDQQPNNFENFNSGRFDDLEMRMTDFEMRVTDVLKETNDKVVSQNKVLDETPTSITNEIELITWSCFKYHMLQSDIADKDLIIRVLDLYTDTIKRIEEIYNLSETYSEIEDGLKTWSCD